MDDSYIRQAKELISKIISPEVSEQVGQWSNFFGAWGKAAGERFAAHSKPVDVRNGILLVEADHPGWIQLLQLEQHAILKRLQRSFPKLGIKGMGFRVGEGKPEQRVIETHDRFQMLSPEARNEPEKPPAAKGDIDSVLASVGDDDFRAILASLAKTVTDKDADGA